MQTFGDLVRLLMERRGIKGTQLSELIELSPTSISKILKGHSKPKQVTLSRLLKALCVTPEEEQAMLKAITGEAHELPELLVEDTEANEREEIARAERYLEMKTQSIAFKRSVARELDRAGIPYEQDFCDRIFSTDFLIEREGQRFALECKFNVLRDMDKTATTMEIIKKQLHCDEAILVVPHITPELEKLTKRGIQPETVSAVASRILMQS